MTSGYAAHKARTTGEKISHVQLWSIVNVYFRPDFASSILETLDEVAADCSPEWKGDLPDPEMPSPLRVAHFSMRTLRPMVSKGWLMPIYEFPYKMRPSQRAKWFATEQGRLIVMANDPGLSDDLHAEWPDPGA